MGSCGRRASSPGVPRATVRQPPCLTVQPAEPHSARTPRSPMPLGSSRRWKPAENTPVACAQSGGGLATSWSLTWSLSHHHPPPKKIRSDYQLLDSPAILGRGQRSGSCCRWERCHQTAASHSDYPHSLFLGSELPSPQLDRF